MEENKKKKKDEICYLFKIIGHWALRAAAQKGVQFVNWVEKGDVNRQLEDAEYGSDEYRVIVSMDHNKAETNHILQCSSW